MPARTALPFPRSVPSQLDMRTCPRQVVPLPPHPPERQEFRPFLSPSCPLPQFPNCDQTSALLPAVEQLREARNPGRPPVAYVNPAVSPIIQFGLVPTPRGVDTDNVLSLADKCTTLSSLVLPVASTDRLSTNIYQLLTEDRCYKEERAKDGRPLLTEPQVGQQPKRQP